MSAKLVLFVLLALMMSAAAIVLAILPLFRRQASAEPSKQEVNLQVLRDQLTELEADLAAGTLSQSQFDEAKQDIAQRLFEELPSEQEVKAALEVKTVQPTSSRPLAIGLSIAVPLLSFVLYLFLGNPIAMLEDERNMAGDERAQQENENAKHPITPEKVQAMIVEIKAHLKKEPNDGRAWAILARAYHYLGQFKEAVDTYRRALPLNPGDADLQADYQTASDLLAQSGMNGRKMGEGGPQQQGAEQSKVSISGRISLAPQLKSQTHSEDMVYVFAKAENGPPMPLAVLRMKVSDLPSAFTLDESMAMMPQLKLSHFPKVIVGARISRSGNAIPSSGDLQGVVKGVVPGSTGVNIEITERIP